VVRRKSIEIVYAVRDVKKGCCSRCCQPLQLNDVHNRLMNKHGALMKW